MSIRSTGRRSGGYSGLGDSKLSMNRDGRTICIGGPSHWKLVIVMSGRGSDLAASAGPVAARLQVGAADGRVGMVVRHTVAPAAPITATASTLTAPSTVVASPAR